MDRLRLFLSTGGSPENAATEGTKQLMSQSNTKPVLLVISFGTSYPESRELTIGAVEKALEKAYPDYQVRRAFTSQVILDILKQRDGLEIDNVRRALERLVADGVRDVVIQPTHVITGSEYHDVLEEVAEFAERFRSVKVGRALLTLERDYDALISILVEDTKAYGKDTAIVYMGHGTEHAANDTYDKLQRKLWDKGYVNYFVGTVEAEPTVGDVLELVKKTDARRVVLIPLMLVAGDHATNDMAGTEEDSWKGLFEQAGYSVTCLLKGLGQYPAVQEMLIGHVADAIAGPEFSYRPQTARPMPETLADGVYSVEVRSSSPMFRVTECRLRVENGAMTADLILSGDGYGRLYPGTAAQAEQADPSRWILPHIDRQGRQVFSLPVASVSRPAVCAAWSVGRNTWYDRNLTFCREKSHRAEDR